MYVKDYMSTELVTIEPHTSILNAQDLLKQHDINRLPVMAKGKLVGLVTKDIINRNLPSNATSLSKNEVNYLLDKINSEDIMDSKPLVVDPDTLLDQAAALMVEHNRGALVVVEHEQLVGIITDKDIFKAFIDISGSKESGTTIVIALAEDKQGVIEEIGDSLVETENNLTHMIVYYQPEEKTIRIVVSVNTDKVDELCQSITSKGYDVMSVFHKP